MRTVLIFLALVSVGCSQQTSNTSDIGASPEQNLTLPQAPVIPGSSGLPSHCSASNGVYSISLPIYYDRPDSRRFNYYFQIRLATSVDWRYAPVVYANSGGPGATAIVKPGEPPSIAAVPNFMNVIYTDVRGVGCNANSENPFQRDAYKTDYFAKDNLSIIYLLGLKNYYIYGVSYGTVLVTTMADLVATYPMPQPKAIILEGTFGKKVSTTEWLNGWQAQWVKTRSTLPPTVVSMLSNSRLPLEFSSVDWMGYITAMLKLGVTDRFGNPLLNTLAQLDSPDLVTRQKAESAVKYLIPLLNGSYFTDVTFTVWCEELFGDLTARDFIGGNIIEYGPDVCAPNGYTLARPYDSAQHQIKVPIYYFQGNEDPTTPNEGAYYHFDNQRLVKRNFVLVSGAGHGPLTTTLKGLGCSDAIWWSIAYLPSYLQSAINTCNWPFTLQTKNAEQ